MKPDLLDVLIVGAGPAGSFAAERLAQGGARVALFDGRPAGEPKACGGGVTAKALKAWPHLLGAVGRTVDELEMYSPSGKHLHLKLDEPFAIYSRVAFDSYLRERARAAGAEVVFTKITSRGIKKTADGWTLRDGNGGEWSGTMLVGADGANSAIARMLIGPLPTSEMGIAFGYLAPLPKDIEPRTIIAFLPGWPGYAWAFPRIDHVSFGIAISQNDFRHRPLDQLLWGLMIGYYLNSEQMSTLCTDMLEGGNREKIEESLRKSVQTYAARVPQVSQNTWQFRQTVGTNWALIGDAAGFVDPITDEGIYYALRSAELFAGAFSEGDILRYQSMWSNDFGKELSRASGMRGLFYGKLLTAPFTERMINLASVHRGIRRTLAELISGDRQYVGLKRSLAFRSLWPFGIER